MNNSPTPMSAKKRFQHLAGKKGEVLRRARRASELTIPSVLPPEGHTEGSKLSTPHQGTGARCVNTLAAKMMLALFPPNTGFFKLSPDPDLGLEGEDEAEARNGLSEVEQRVIRRIEQTKMRSVMSTLKKHLIITGNGVLHVMADEQFRFFGLNHYVCERDPAGSVILLILKESVSPATLDEKILKAVFDKHELKEFEDKPDASVELFTTMRREGSRFLVSQELNGQEVPGSAGSYPLSSPPFIVLRWTIIPDEEYGRGMVDEYLGDFEALDALSRDLLKGSAAAAKIVWTTSPNSTIRAKDLETAESGAVLVGDNEDVGTVGLDKFADFRITLERVNAIEQQLERAFLVHSSVQRDAERVTAEEIRYLAQELEDALGGVYSVLAQELQIPLVKRYLALLKRKGTIPQISDNDVQLQVTTGLQALGRGHALNKLLAMVRQAKEVLGEDEVVRRINPTVFFTELETGFGLSLKGLWRSDEEVATLLQNAQLMQTLQDSAPGVLKNLTQPNQGATNG